jgi:hypothetical protein
MENWKRVADYLDATSIARLLRVCKSMQFLNPQLETAKKNEWCVTPYKRWTQYIISYFSNNFIIMIPISVLNTLIVDVYNPIMTRRYC